MFTYSMKNMCVKYKSIFIEHKIFLNFGEIMYNKHDF